MHAPEKPTNQHKKYLELCQIINNNIKSYIEHCKKNNINIYSFCESKFLDAINSLKSDNKESSANNNFKKEMKFIFSIMAILLTEYSISTNQDLDSEIRNKSIISEFDKLDNITKLKIYKICCCLRKALLTDDSDCLIEDIINKKGYISRKVWWNEKSVNLLLTTIIKYFVPQNVQALNKKLEAYFKSNKERQNLLGDVCSINKFMYLSLKDKFNRNLTADEIIKDAGKLLGGLICESVQNPIYATTIAEYILQIEDYLITHQEYHLNYFVKLFDQYLCKNMKITPGFKGGIDNHIKLYKTDAEDNQNSPILDVWLKFEPKPKPSTDNRNLSANSHNRPTMLYIAQTGTDINTTTRHTSTSFEIKIDT